MPRKNLKKTPSSATAEKPPESAKPSATPLDPPTENFSPPKPEESSLPPYTPPPPPTFPASDLPPMEVIAPSPALSETEENPSFSKSTPTETSPPTPAKKTPTRNPAPAERPAPDRTLGTGSLECFVFSASHDDDAQFFLSYGLRYGSMKARHGDKPEAQAGLARLEKLLTE
jgi:hypothetical protein